MKQQIMYIHGGEAYSDYAQYLEHLRTVPIEPFAEPSKRWTHTLRTDLGPDYEVFMPTMPNKHNAKYEEWKIWFERHFTWLQDEVILVGWSQGAMFLCKYLSENELSFTVKALVLLATPVTVEVTEPGGEDGGDFLFSTDTVSTIQAKVPQIILMHSKDDFVVPYTDAEMLAELLPAAELVTFSDKNHFLVEEFPELLAKLETIAKKVPNSEA